MRTYTKQSHHKLHALFTFRMATISLTSRSNVDICYRDFLYINQTSMEHKPLRLHIGATTYPGVSHSGPHRRHGACNNSRSSSARPAAPDTSSGPVDADADAIANSPPLGLNARVVFDGVAHLKLPKACVRRVLSCLVACCRVAA